MPSLRETAFFIGGPFVLGTFSVAAFHAYETWRTRVLDNSNPPPLLNGIFLTTRLPLADLNPLPSETPSNSPTNSPSPSLVPPPNCEAGMWVDRGTDFAHLDPVCCGWDRRRRGRALEEINNGTEAIPPPVCGWTGVNQNSFGGQAFSGNDIEVLPTGGFACQCTPERQRAIQGYEWEPTHCHLPSWNATNFCRQLKGRSILWLGDSAGGQLATTVHNYIVWGRGGCGHAMVHHASDTLVGKKYGVLNRGRPWVEVIRSLPSPPDIVVLGTGPHISAGSGTASYLEVLNTVRKEYLENFANTSLTFVWRTNLGAGCLVAGDALKPLPESPKALEGYWAKVNATQNLYNFQLLEQWDDIAVDFWKEAGKMFRNVHTLDLRPLWRRPDAMQGAGQDRPWNCIHLCTPGPLRFAARQLHKTLTLIDNEKH